MIPVPNWNMSWKFYTVVSAWKFEGVTAGRIVKQKNNTISRETYITSCVYLTVMHIRRPIVRFYKHSLPLLYTPCRSHPRQSNPWNNCYHVDCTIYMMSLQHGCEMPVCSTNIPFCLHFSWICWITRIRCYKRRSNDSVHILGVYAQP